MRQSVPAHKNKCKYLFARCAYSPVKRPIWATLERHPKRRKAKAINDEKQRRKNQRLRDVILPTLIRVYTQWGGLKSTKGPSTVNAPGDLANAHTVDPKYSKDSNNKLFTPISAMYYSWISILLYQQTLNSSNASGENKSPSSYKITGASE